MATTAGSIELPAGVRVIRRLMPPEAPWPAALVRTDDGASCMLVDVGRLTDWDGWGAEPNGHVLGPRDVLRSPRSHDVLLPLCTERIEALLARRGIALPLSPGEAVTLSVSVLRGMVEVAERDTQDAAGAWWLTVEGRPVFVDDRDGPAAAATSAELLERVADAAAPPLRDAVREASEAIREPRRLVRTVDELEQRLFDAAAAEPLATTPLASGRARQAHAEADPAHEHGDGPGQTWGALLLASVDSDLADAFSRATTRLWRGLRRPPRPGHRRPWAIAGCLGAGVIAAGLLWPGAEGPAVAGADAPTPAASTAEAAGPTPPSQTQAQKQAQDQASPPPATSGALAATTEELLETRNSCIAAGGGDCLAQVLEDPARPVAPGIVDAAPADRMLTLLDEFGGVAVLRAESPSDQAPPQLVVITNSDGMWLLRDVHDVAKQP